MIIGDIVPSFLAFIEAPKMLQDRTLVLVLSGLLVLMPLSSMPSILDCQPRIFRSYLSGFNIFQWHFLMQYYLSYLWNIFVWFCSFACIHMTCINFDYLYFSISVHRPASVKSIHCSATEKSVGCEVPTVSNLAQVWERCGMPPCCAFWWSCCCPWLWLWWVPRPLTSQKPWMGPWNTGPKEELASWNNFQCWSLPTPATWMSQSSMVAWTLHICLFCWLVWHCCVTNKSHSVRFLSRFEPWLDG